MRGRKVTYHRRRLRQLPPEVLPDLADFFVDRSNLDRHAKGKGRMLRQRGERVVHVLEREDDNTAQVFLGFGEGAVGDDDLARIRPQRLGGSRILEPDAAQPLATLDAFFVEGDALLYHRLKVGFRFRGPGRLIDVTEAGEANGLGRNRWRRARDSPFGDGCRLALER